MAETVFIKSKKEHNYTVMDNTFLRDTRLSFRAKGIFAYLLSLPEDWEIHLSELQEHGTEGRDAFNTAIKELQNYGYLIIDQTRDVQGRYGRTIYTIVEVPSECPKTDNPITEKPISDNPITEKPISENPTLLNTNNTKYLNIQNTNNIRDSRFKKPTVEEIREYCTERHNAVDPERFFDFYESKNWFVGKSKMKDWKASVRTWERNSFSNSSKPTVQKKFTPVVTNTDELTESQLAEIPF